MSEKKKKKLTNGLNNNEFPSKSLGPLQREQAENKKKMASHGTLAMLGLALLLALVSLAPSVDARGQARVQRRYVEFNPPRILPEEDSQTVKAGSQYSVRCEGRNRGVSWRLPVDASDDLPERVRLDHRVERRARERSPMYIAEMTIRDLGYLDTGTFVCTYNGTTDTTSIDNSTRIHLYVEDGTHLMKQSGVDFMQAVQFQPFTLPCQPTHPDVNVTLYRDGSGKVELSQFLTFNPKVSSGIDEEGGRSFFFRLPLGIPLCCCFFISALIGRISGAKTDSSVFSK